MALFGRHVERLATGVEQETEEVETTGPEGTSVRKSRKSAKVAGSTLLARLRGWDQRESAGPAVQVSITIAGDLAAGGYLAAAAMLPGETPAQCRARLAARQLGPAIEVQTQAAGGSPDPGDGPGGALPDCLTGDPAADVTPAGEEREE